LLTDELGAEAGEHHYYPYGRYAGGSQEKESTFEFTGHERDVHGLTDYMLGRTYVHPYMRFASVDRARDGWNLYGYVRGNPMKFVDPDGERRKLVFDFTESGLSPRQQRTVARGIAQRFRNAGVRDVNTFLSPRMDVPRDHTKFDRTSHIAFTNRILKSPTALGRTPPFPGNKSEVTMRHAPTGTEDHVLNYAINVGAHD
jgi:RHS repeat-associated protein